MTSMTSEFEIHSDLLNYGPKAEALQGIMESVFHAIEAEQPNGPAEFCAETYKRIDTVEKNLGKVLEIYPRGFVVNPDAYVERSAVLAILNRLLEQAEKVAASVGAKPTAKEALDWAYGEIAALGHPEPVAEP